MKEDTPGNHPDGFLPILDTKMAVIGGQIVHHHYSKPMASLEITLKRSAMSTASKYNILVQEGNRRLKNMSPDTTWNDKLPLINKLMIQMLWAGYSFKDREIVARRIMAKYQNDMKSLIMESKPLYRTKMERNKELKVNKATWFRQMGATTTIKVPMTRNSELAKRLRIVLGQNPGPRGTSVKIQEQPGCPILSGLAKNNPFKSGVCHKGNCPLDGQKCDGLCSKESIIYKATCTRCEQQQIDEGVDLENIIQRQYTGETARTLRVRSDQHFKDYYKCHEIQPEPESEASSFMYDHMTDKHKDVKKPSREDFKFQVVKQFNDTMTRQHEEAIRIQHSINNNIHTDSRGRSSTIVSLNRKHEYFAARKRAMFDF